MPKLRIENKGFSRVPYQPMGLFASQLGNSDDGLNFRCSSATAEYDQKQEVWKPRVNGKVASNDIVLKGGSMFPLNYVRKWREQSGQMATLSLLSELSHADSSLDIAIHIFDIERRENLCKEALGFYNMAIQSLSEGSLSARDRTYIDQRLDRLRTRLAHFGIMVERNDDVTRKTA